MRSNLGMRFSNQAGPSGGQYVNWRREERSYAAAGEFRPPFIRPPSIATRTAAPAGSAEGRLLFKSHWEFIRRYVAVGPPSVIEQIQFSIPISEKRESLSVGIHRVLADSWTGSPWW